MSQKKVFLSSGEHKVSITLADEEDRNNLEALMAATAASQPWKISDQPALQTAPAATQKNEVKHYNAEGFLEAAQKYLNDSPPDLEKACEKLWATMACLFKKRCLEAGYKLTSDNSLRQMAEWIFKKPSLLSPAVAECGLRLFIHCERFHQHGFEGSKAEVASVVTDLKEFLSEFNQIKLDALKLVLEKKKVEFQGSDDVTFEEFKMEVEDMGLKYTKTQWKIHVSEVTYY
ncbi:unnamed protein product, partial [Mesorhabditis belari]|uniref:Uncharacterized protein n=1 Tax=Mesorhabditis belari TaxID=2138241 RepID=A0AAF3FG97_9BILA